MKITKRPMFTTIIYGLLCGLSFVPIIIALSYLLYWPAAFRLIIWLYLAGYLAILTRWGRVRLLSIIFPLLGSLLKTLGTEVALCLGGGALVAFFAPHSTITWAMAVWTFFLIQSLYFVVFRDLTETEEEEVELDPFEQARGQVEKILSTGLQ
jgi:hypothetical protein